MQWEGSLKWDDNPGLIEMTWMCDLLKSLLILINIYIDFMSSSCQAIPGGSCRSHICGGVRGVAQVQTYHDTNQAPAGRWPQRRTRTSRSSDSRWCCSLWYSRSVKGGRTQRLGVCATHIWNNWPSKDCEGATHVYTPQYTASEVSVDTFKGIVQPNIKNYIFFLSR